MWKTFPTIQTSQIEQIFYFTIIPKSSLPAISQLDMNKLSGSDKINVVILKKIVPKLSFIFSNIFNMCLHESLFPNWLKISSVAPIFGNAGAKSYHQKYRPTTMLSVISKLFERLISSKLVYLVNLIFNMHSICHFLLIFNMPSDTYAQQQITWL